MYKTLIVIDNKEYHLDENFADMIDFDTYLTDYPKQNEPKTRIINLCDTRHYLSKGYYCSLLAEARCHKILPSVKTINGLKHLNDDDEAIVPYKSYLMGLNLPEQALQIMVYFGHCDNQHFECRGGVNVIVGKWPSL
ncbi:MAG: RimK-like ATPgrasp N-terminal domain-containing protein [Exilibacterium sp.]